MSRLETHLPVSELFEACYLEFNGILPLEPAGKRLRVAVAGDPAVEVLDDVELSYGLPLELVRVDREELVDAIRRTFAAAESTVELVRDLDGRFGIADEVAGDLATDARDLANQPPVVRYVNLLIREAHDAAASDIHLEAARQSMRVRLRLDGVLVDAPAPPRNLQAAVVSRIKLIADLDIAERRAPQDGRLRVRLEERELDLRVSTVPTLYGESVVLRLLDRGGRPVALDELGMHRDTLEPFRARVEKPHGIVLATGPTGSGKTTTLYAALGLRRSGDEKIITQEDPIGLAGGLNLYGFANGDPINFRDPFGLCPTCAILQFLTRPITITMANNQTWDRVSPNVQAGIDIAARFSGVNEVGVSWTTGGAHGRSSRHYPDNFGGVGMAADIYSLDGMLVSDPAAGDNVRAFQSILDMVPEARENFGPAMIHKEGKPYCTESAQACTDLKNDHKDHVHYSVNK